jgi:thiosulfate dehydrogenase [quinone] large subunit
MLPESNAAKRNALALAGLRIAVGSLFLIFAQYKVLGTHFTLGGGFQFWINRFLQDGEAYPFMIPVLQRFVLAHATAIAFIVAYGELAIGVALVFGAAVRAASVFGLLYMLGLLFSSNYPGAHVALWQYFGASLDHSVLALCFLTFFTSRSEELLSVRGLLKLRQEAVSTPSAAVTCASNAGELDRGSSQGVSRNT